MQSDPIEFILVALFLILLVGGCGGQEIPERSPTSEPTPASVATGTPVPSPSATALPRGVRQQIFYELIATLYEQAATGAEDANQWGAYRLVADRYGLSVETIQRIAAEGVAANWARPSPPGPIAPSSATLTVTGTAMPEPTDTVATVEPTTAPPTATATDTRTPKPTGSPSSTPRLTGTPTTVGFQVLPSSICP